MPRAISCMRSTSATYSSCRPGMRRERNTVTIMGRSLSLGLLLVLRQRAEPGNPRPRRAVPILPLGRQLIALAQNADPHHVGGLSALARRGRIDRRAAFAAERLQPRVAAVGRGLEVAGGLAGHREGVAGHRHRDAERRARAGLTVGAMADRDFLGIRLALDGDRAAMARAVDSHVLLLSPPPSRSPACRHPTARNDVRSRA